MTKKGTAFALFDEGKSPSSPKVKGLKLKSQSRYKYYYEWQKSKGVLHLHRRPLGKLRGRVGKL